MRCDNISFTKEKQSYENIINGASNLFFLIKFLNKYTIASYNIQQLLRIELNCFENYSYKIAAHPIYTHNQNI